MDSTNKTTQKKSSNQQHSDFNQKRVSYQPKGFGFEATNNREFKKQT
jgi:hypothetical protein